MDCVDWKFWCHRCHVSFLSKRGAYLSQLTPPFSWTYLARDAPKYPIGHSINLGAQAIVGALALTGIVWIVRENRLRARGGRDSRLMGLKDDDDHNELGHLHPSFRYIP